MAEDQGQNGDMWVREASALLTRLGWQKIADSNIDIKGSDDLNHGIDALFKYYDSYQEINQGVFIEAKRYRTTSFNPKKIQDWINCINEKMNNLRHSEEFNDRYPAMRATNPQNGLLVIWFHNTEDYNTQFHNHFLSTLQSVRTSRARTPRVNRLFVLSNYDILRLASLVNALNSWNSEHRADQNELCYFYPSTISNNTVSKISNELVLEYIYSQFVITRAQIRNTHVQKTAHAVFYFGELDMSSFKSLKTALLSLNIPNSHDDLYLYIYESSDEFRKIKPDVKALFEELHEVHFEIKTMDRLSNLPGWIKDAGSE